MLRVLRFLAPLFKRGRLGNNRIEQLPAEDPLTHARKMLARARRQLEHKNVARAQINIGFGEILSGESPLEYLLDAGRLWMEFGHWLQAYDYFLAAELQAEDSSFQEAIQIEPASPPPPLPYRDDLIDRAQRRDQGALDPRRIGRAVLAGEE